MNDKPRIMWAVKHPRYGSLLDWTVRRTRLEAIGEFCTNYDEPWNPYYREGFRAVKVQVQEVED
jgi:hypothetical protein